MYIGRRPFCGPSYPDLAVISNKFLC
jgi:hypothetical protein